MTYNVEQAKRRAYQYWYSDGFSEIVSGGIFLLVAGLNLTEIGLSPDNPLRYILILVMTLSVIVGGFFARRLIGKLKEHHTYPRTGYVQYRRAHRKQRWSWLVLGFVIMGSYIALGNIAPSFTPWLMLLTDVFIGGVFVYMGYYVGIKRLYVTGVFAVLLGIFITALRIANPMSLIVYYGGLGTWLAGSGVLALVRYLQTAPPPDEEAVDV